MMRVAIRNICPCSYHFVIAVWRAKKQCSGIMKTTTLQLQHSVNRSHCPLGLLLIPLALACFGLAPAARAACREGCSATGGNTFLGEDALGSNSGSFNTATGFNALQFNTNGVENTASGAGALLSNTTGNNNTASGFDALQLNTTGNDNTATGVAALEFNTVGSNNIGVGYFAGSNLTTGSNNIDIGHTGIAGESNTIRIGKRGVQNTTVIAGIRGITISGGIAVMIDGNGRLGTNTSSARYKDNIQPMDKASEAILSLQPVSFRYKKELDPAGIPQFGVVAEQVEKVNPDLVARDDDGKPYTVRYEAVNAMLLNEFLKEHRKNAEQEAMISELKSTDAQQQKQIEALTVMLQKVSAQLELSKPATQTALNNH